MAKCDDALSAYNLLLLDGVDIESKIQKDCADRRDLKLIFRLIFLLWGSIVGQALLCLILHIGPLWLCEAIFTVALVVILTLFLILLGVIALTVRLRDNRKKCRDLNKRLKDAFDAVKRDCPEERWPAELSQFKCDCQ